MPPYLEVAFFLEGQFILRPSLDCLLSDYSLHRIGVEPWAVKQPEPVLSQVMAPLPTTGFNSKVEAALVVVVGTTVIRPSLTATLATLLVAWVAGMPFVLVSQPVLVLVSWMHMATAVL